MKNKLLLLTCAFLSISLTVSAQSWLWGEEGTGSLKADLSGSGIATNKTGNVYATGSYETSITFGATILTSSASTDMFLVKYDQNGNVLWANTSENNANGRISGASVASDDSDNAYVTGFGLNFFQGADTVSFGTDTLDLPISYSFLVKYNASGNVVWATQPNIGVIPVFSVAAAVTTDKFGHEYVTGGNSAPFLIKYDRNGNNIWSVQEKVGSSGFDFASGYSVATDVSGNVYVAGYFTDSLYLGSNKFFSPNQGIFIAKYDSNGNVLWAQQSNNNQAYNYIAGIPAVTTDPSGAAYLTGIFYKTITFGSYNFSSSDSNDFVVVKYNPSGSIAWAKQALPNNSFGWDSYSICADDSNHIYVSGGENSFGIFNNNSSFVFSGDTISIHDTVAGDLPVFLLKLDTTGKVLCSSTLSSSGKKTNGVTADSTGKFVYMAGTFDDSIAIGSDNLTDNTGGYDTYIARWQSCYICNLSVSITPAPVDICYGLSITLTAPASGLSYTWSPSAGLSATTGDTVIANPTVTTTYTVIGTNVGGCFLTDTDVITVEHGPLKPIITISVTGDTLFSSAKNGNEWFFNDTIINGATDSFLIITGRQSGWYYLEVINQANGCSTVSDSVEAGINQLTLTSNQLSVYPNPTNGTINVKINSSASGIKDWNLQLTDVLGRTLYTASSLDYNNEIDMSNLSPGMYFITVINRTSRAAVPVVKE